MKRIMMLISVCLFSITVLAQNDQIKAIDAKNGYKDLAFETDLNEFLANRKTLKLPSKKDGTITYKLLDAKYLNVGECKIQEVDAIFFQNKLMTFNIKVDKENKICYLNALYYSWGNGLLTVNGKDAYVWNGDRCIAIFQDDPSMTAGTLVLSTKKLKDEYNNYSQNKDKLNSNDL